MIIETLCLVFLVGKPTRKDSCGGGGKTWKVSKTFQVSLDGAGGTGKTWKVLEDLPGLGEWHVFL